MNHGKWEIFHPFTSSPLHLFLASRAGDTAVHRLTRRLILHSISGQFNDNLLALWKREKLIFGSA
jgi:hypothetical protein